MITHLEQIPELEDFLHLRKVCPSEKTAETASKGLPNSLFSVIAVAEGKTIAMGRVVGDRGLNFEIVDIAVLPEFQGRGIGRKLMEHIMIYLE